MNERDKELMKQAETECGFNPDKFADLIRADERDEILKLADSLGWVDVDNIRARGNT